jgi:hypothetical protein
MYHLCVEKKSSLFTGYIISTGRICRGRSSTLALRILVPPSLAIPSHEPPNPRWHRRRRRSPLGTPTPSPAPPGPRSRRCRTRPDPAGAPDRPSGRLEKTMNGAAAPERSPSPSPPPPAQSPTQLLEWRFSQVFGERSAGEEVQDGTDRSL